MVNIDLVYFDAGGGHRAAALALQGAITARKLPWNVRRVHLTRVLDPTDLFGRFSGMRPEDVYNRRLARGWTLGLGSELKLLQAMIRAAHGPLVKALADHWHRSEPDLVVSLVPNFNRALHQSLARARPGVPFVTVMTDLADHPPGFWIEPGLDQHLVCGTAHACRQALDAGCRPERVHPVSGMILRREFHQPAAVDRVAAARALGLDPSRPTGLVMFGSEGSARMLKIADTLDDVQLLFLCGHEFALVDALRERRRAAPHAAIGFTSEVRRHMLACDFFIGKPGPGAISEALQCGLPVITFRNAWTLPQERFNTYWVEARGVGRVVASVRGLAPAVADVVARLDTLRAAVGAIENRAVFEVTDLLATLAPREHRPGAQVERAQALAA